MTRREWATMLGMVCSPSFPAEGVEALVDMLPLLQKYDDSFFTAQTVELVGSAKRRQSIPSLDEITAIFAKLRNDRLPIQQRMGGAVSVAQITRQFVPDSDDVKAATLAKAEALIADLSADAPAARTAKPEIEPRYFTKLQLALAAAPEVLAIRPDLRAALEEHRRQQDRLA
jgi:hypothetical protein